MKKFGFLFSCDYFDNLKPDSDYAEEFLEARKRMFPVFLFNTETLFQNNKLVIKDASVKYESPNKNRKQETLEILIYRGWMLSEKEYTLLYNELDKIGYKLINTPEQYIACHHLPNWYDAVKDDTALSNWTVDLTRESVIEKLAAFGLSSLIVKDYVKSRKHEWVEACFIPNAADTANAMQVVETFVKRQAEDLVGGVVLRKFLDLKMIGTHSKSNMPIANEIRVFVFMHSVLAEIEYWSGKSLLSKDNDYHDLVSKYAGNFSNFFTIDLAQKEDGSWIIIEIGDGQVSGLQGLPAVSFYRAFAQRQYDPDMKNVAYGEAYLSMRQKNEALLFQDKNKQGTKHEIISENITSTRTGYGHTADKEVNYNFDGFEREIFRSGISIYKYRSIYGISGDFCKVIKHRDGNEYLVFKKYLYGHSVLNLTDLTDFHYMPAGALKGEEPFIWCEIYYNAINNILAVDGCLWAGPYDFLLFDFSKPFEPDEFQFMLIDKDICLDDQKVDEEIDAGDFSPWNGKDLVVPAYYRDEFDEEKKSKNITIKQETYMCWLNDKKIAKANEIF